jgi:predicted MFS family arabinose efflux permease
MSDTPHTPEGAAPAASHAVAQNGSFRAQLATILLSRTVLNTAHRIVYPFLPSIARGLDISLAAASGLVTVRMLAGLTAPFFGPLTDRRSRRGTMEVALLLFSLASLLLVAAGSLTVAAVAAAVIAFLLYGLSKVLYDPAIYAYLGDTIPYRLRGRATGLVEFSWAAAWLLGVPIAGLLLDRFGWRVPWAALFALGLLSLGLTHRGLPPAWPTARSSEATHGIALLLHSWRRLLGHRGVLALLLTNLLLMMAIEVPFIVYGAWLETDFGLGLSTLGLASIVVGLAEAAAELGTALLTDPLGKRRSVLIGLLGMAGSLLLLPTLARLGLAPALAGIVLVVLTFEFAIVSLLPMATELVPGERATLLSLRITAASLGRMAGAVMGGLLWEWQGGDIGLHAGVGAACALAAAGLMFWGMVEIED